jgi:hypothetical protein
MAPLNWLCLQTIVSKELANLEPIAYQYFSRNMPYVSNVQLHPPLGYDPEKVRLMLAAANWTVGPDGVRRNSQGQPLVGGLLPAVKVGWRWRWSVAWH